MADACLEAMMVGGGSMWLEPLERAVAWFSGHNDTGVALYDPETGACADGLTPHGRNENLGAESTLSAIGAFQARLAADRMLTPVR